jgi:tetratricopeptide (TPR) repeat protein
MNKLLLFIISIVFFISSFKNSNAQTKGITVINDLTEIPGATKALIVGVSDYKNLPKLTYAHSDAQLYYNYITSAAGGKIDPANVKLLLNEKATAGQIFAALDWLLENLKEGDNAIFYFSGHGDLETKTIRQNGFLMASDAPAAAYMSGGTIGINYLQDYLETYVQKNKAKVFLVTDACRSGKLAGGIEGAKQTTTALQAQWANIIKILSSQSGELSYESSRWGKGGGIFTYYMVRGMQGFADKNKDKKVTLSELNVYLTETVPVETEYKQNPYIAGNLMSTVSLIDSATFAALKLNLNNTTTGTEVASRGLGDGLEKKLDSNTLKKFQQFELCIKNDYLIYPNKTNSCAWDIYQELKDNKNASSVISNMKSSLIAALQDQSQIIINSLLVGKINLARDTVILDSAYQDLNHAFQLIDNKYITYNHIKARYLYMKSVRTSDNKEKINLLKECIALEPDAPHPYNYMATVDKYMKNYESSVKNYLKAIELAPTWSYPYNNLGILYYVMKEYDKSIENYNKAVALNPKDEAALNNLGNTYFAKSDYSKAIENYNKSISVNPKFALPHSGMGNVYLVTKDFDKAAESYKKAIEINPKYADAYVNLGSVYKEKMDYDKAIENYKKAIELKPNLSDPYNNLGLVYLLKKDYENALTNCTKAIMLNPKNDLAFLNVGNIYKAKKEYDKAIEKYNTVLALNPKSANANFNLACVYSMKNDKTKALEYLKKAYDLGYSGNEIKSEELDNIRNTKEFKEITSNKK